MVALVVTAAIVSTGGCRTLAAAADPMNAEDCRVFVPGAGNGQVLVEGLDAYAVSLGVRRHLARLDGHRLLFDTPLGPRETGQFDGRKMKVDTGLTDIHSTELADGRVVLKGIRFQKLYRFNSRCSLGQAAVGTYALFELNRRRQKY